MSLRSSTLQLASEEGGIAIDPPSARPINRRSGARSTASAPPTGLAGASRRRSCPACLAISSTPGRSRGSTARTASPAGASRSANAGRIASECRASGSSGRQGKCARSTTAFRSGEPGAGAEARAVAAHCSRSRRGHGSPPVRRVQNGVAVRPAPPRRTSPSFGSPRRRAPCPRARGVRPSGRGSGPRKGGSSPR